MADLTTVKDNNDNDTFAWYGPITINGEKEYDGPALKVPVSIIMLVSLVVSLVGNLCTCAVIVRDRSMRTPTNCYLFNLAIADLTTAMFIPFEIYRVWAPDSFPFGEVGCVIHVLVLECLSNCSLLTIAAFTVERYLAVSKPFLRHKLALKTRVFMIVALNWFISACFGIPDLFLIRLHQENNQTYCYVTVPFFLKLEAVTEMCVFFIMPMTIIFVLYILIAIKIKSKKTFNKTSPVNGKQYRDKTIMMLDNNDNDTFAWYGPIAINGEKEYDGPALKVPVSIIMLVSLVVSLVGNLCTCAVIVRDRSMRTPTNCYLFNLAIADLTTAMFIPFEIYLVWAPDSFPFGEVGCVIHVLVWECLSNCSLLTITAFTVERYLAVSKPFLRHKLALKTRVFMIVALNWFISACFGIPDLFLIRLHQDNNQTYCYVTVPFFLKLVTVTEMCVFFIMPMTIIFVLYILIAIKIKSKKTFNKTSPVNGKQYRDKTIMMLAAVAATFFFCWFPYFLLRLLIVVPLLDWKNSSVVRILRYVCIANAYIYTAVNPILYSLMSRKFSLAFKDLLKGRRRSHVYTTSGTRKATTVQCLDVSLKDLNLQTCTDANGIIK